MTDLPSLVVERMTKEVLEKRCIDFLADTKVSIKEWGLGPKRIHFDTKIGETFGSRLTQKQLDMLREGDRRVHRSVKEMIEKVMIRWKWRSIVVMS